MKRILLVLVVFLFVLILSCKKENEKKQNAEPVCPCEEPTPLSSDGSIPDISWRNYNSVHDACFHFERLVKMKDLIYGRLLDYPCFEHIGDTLKVYGWLYNAENTYMDRPGDWISNDAKYASGIEKYPPWTGVGGGYGYGIQLNNLHVTDSTHIKNKCFLTGIIGFTSFYTMTGEADIQCEHLMLKLNVVDFYFEEDEK